MVVLHLTLARPYAKALFTEAKENDQLTSWLVILNILTKIIKNRSIVSIINNPNVLDKEIQGMLLELLLEIEPEITYIVKERLGNFLQLLIDAKRLIVLPNISLLYRNLLNEYRRVTEAEIISAFLVNDDQREQIKKTLEERFNSEVKLSIVIDKSLLGGAIIRADNWVVDGSIRGKLDRLRKNLRGGKG